MRFSNGLTSVLCCLRLHQCSMRNCITFSVHEHYSTVLHVEMAFRVASLCKRTLVAPAPRLSSTSMLLTL